MALTSEEPQSDESENSCSIGQSIAGTLARITADQGTAAGVMSDVLYAAGPVSLGGTIIGGGAVDILAIGLDAASLGLDYLAGNKETLASRTVQVGVQLIPLATAPTVVGRAFARNNVEEAQRTGLGLLVSTPKRRCGLFE